MSRCGDLHFKWNIGALDPALDIVHITLVTKKSIKGSAKDYPSGFFPLQSIIISIIQLARSANGNLGTISPLQERRWHLRK